MSVGCYIWRKVCKILCRATIFWGEYLLIFTYFDSVSHSLPFLPHRFCPSIDKLVHQSNNEHTRKFHLNITNTMCTTVWFEMLLAKNLPFCSLHEYRYVVSFLTDTVLHYLTQYLFFKVSLHVSLDTVFKNGVKFFDSVKCLPFKNITHDFGLSPNFCLNKAWKCIIDMKSISW